MQDWQIELVKAFGLAVIAFVAGFGTNWLKSRERQAELRAKLEDLKATRKIEGSGEVERLERAAKVTEMLITHKEHEITPEQFREFHDEILTGRRRRRSKLPTKKQSAFDEKGPNGGRIEILPNGDKVEWVCDEDSEEEFSMILLRGEKQIHEAEEEFFDKVWWNRHQVWKEKIAEGQDTQPNPQIWATATAAAKRIEDKYGEGNLGWDDFEWGMINGKLSALRWVLGDEWDFLDT